MRKVTAAGWRAVMRWVRSGAPGCRGPVQEDGPGGGEDGGGGDARDLPAGRAAGDDGLYRGVVLRSRPSRVRGQDVGECGGDPVLRASSEPVSPARMAATRRMRRAVEMGFMVSSVDDFWRPMFGGGGCRTVEAWWTAALTGWLPGVAGEAGQRGPGAVCQGGCPPECSSRWDYASSGRSARDSRASSSKIRSAF